MKLEDIEIVGTSYWDKLTPGDYVCSNCRYIVSQSDWNGDTPFGYNYCPSCGFRMMSRKKFYEKHKEEIK